MKTNKESRQWDYNLSDAKREDFVHGNETMLHQN